MTREEYYEMAKGVLSREEFIKMFGIEPVDFQDLTWNYNLETAYNEFLNSVDYYADDEVDEGCIEIDLSDDDFDGDFEDAFEDDYNSNLFCDDTGFCSGSSCPNFYKCHG